MSTLDVTIKVEEDDGACSEDAPASDSKIHLVDLAVIEWSRMCLA